VVKITVLQSVRTTSASQQSTVVLTTVQNEELRLLFTSSNVVTLL